MTSESIVGIRELADLIPLIQQSDGFFEVAESFSTGTTGAIEGAWGSSRALSIAALSKQVSRPLLVILPRVPEIDEVAVDLESWLGTAPEIFPAWQTLPREHSMSDPIFGSRLRTLTLLDAARTADDLPPILVTDITALMQPVPTREAVRESIRELRVEQELVPEELFDWLIERGFERVTLIEAPGEFRVHGGIVDIFPPDALDPVRIEFFGDEIDSLRTFDVETQRSLESLESFPMTVVSPVSFADDAAGSFEGESLLDYLSERYCLVLSEPGDLQQEGRDYLRRLDNPRGLFSTEQILSKCLEKPYVSVSTLSAVVPRGTPVCRLDVESVERLSGPRNQVLQELAELLRADETVLIACHNPGEQERLGELLPEANLEGKVQLCLGHVQRGFRLADSKLLVIGDHELFGRTELHRTPRRRRKIESRAIDNFLDLQAGDLVVHLSHGIGRFRGMKLLDKEGQKEEHLAIEFRDEVLIYVPVSLIHLVQKYIGAKKSTPRLSKIGGTTWSKKKETAARAVMDMASDMIRLQAMREAKPGIACPPDSHWQKEFDAAFPYTETDDQLHAISDVKQDMEQPRPMDRLICGDVGFGKTEVAIRAAFKAIDSGRQVAILVPTTVLAEQHYRTMCERMAEYPIEVEVLSRFRSKAEQKDILERMELGSVDLVVGTHRLIQKDIRFKNLGLLIIDEEQRFGVEAKEMLKQLRLEVDVLTLSATPIPRTLHLSLLGIRDISNLVTPPQERIAIQTQICRWDEQLIRNSIIRELNRGGQVYFVHNRVYNIKTLCDRLKCLVPEARFTIGHGQMGEGELEAAMFDFVTHRVDVLVCTTIIESGLDIPNANTIFIHQAGNYGLSELHQLRGRVGRYRHRAYCYLMLGEGESLTAVASKRLKALEEYSELGAGFKIAMRDLEIRGAGNILGTEQSGHISAVGYELYCQLLENAVLKMKNQPLRDVSHVSIDLPLTALFSDDYIPAGRQKIEMYRKLSLVRTHEELADVTGELKDRFGPLPEESQLLIELKSLQVDARQWEIEDIHLEGDRFAVFRYRNAKKIQQLSHLVGSDLRIVDRNDCYLLLKCDLTNPRELLGRLKSVLQTNRGLT